MSHAASPVKTKTTPSDGSWQRRSSTVTGEAFDAGNFNVSG